MGKNDCDDIATALSLNVLVFTITNMHAMSHQYDLFLTCSSKVNIQEPAFYKTTMYPLTVIQVELSGIQYPTAMSHSQSVNTWLPEVMMSSKNERVCICNLSKLTVQIIVNTW
jgi:hypothetical protein